MVIEQNLGDIYVFLNMIYSTSYIFFAILAPDRCRTGNRFNLLTIDVVNSEYILSFWGVGVLSPGIFLISGC